jgi:16S rRNA (cytidine1402-2'-O)-methyltransferase
MGTLFLVATPIGNLEDITLRAIRVLGEASLVAAEDTRTANVLLKAHGIRAKRLTSYNDHNKRARIPVIVGALSAGDVALISDAGMPGISDPGHDLVVAALEAGHDVVPIPGASAVVAAVAASGRLFQYLGFLPRTAGQRRRVLAAAGGSGDTIVLFEAPSRVRALLADALAVFGEERRLVVCRELSRASRIRRDHEGGGGRVDATLRPFAPRRLCAVARMSSRSREPHEHARVQHAR